MNKAELASKFDHTVLKATATESDVIKLCKEAKDYGFASVCVNPYFVPLVKQELSDSEVLVCTVVGFPLGANPTEVKEAEAEWAVNEGAQEVDMVINIGALKAGDHETVQKDISAVVEASKPAIVKVIIETCYLSDDEKKAACKASKDAGAHFVKTSTGFGTGGATVEDIKLMRAAVGSDLQVKASGGIRTLADAKAMVEAGADRLGASAGVAIMKELGEV